MQRLDLSGFVAVTDTGVAALASMAATLTWLSLAGTRVTNACTPVLARTPCGAAGWCPARAVDRADGVRAPICMREGRGTELVQLKELFLDRTDVTNAGMLALGGASRVLRRYRRPHAPP